MRWFAVLAAMTVFSSTSWAAPESYKIDPSHTAVVFKINHMGFSNVYGMFSGAEGKFTIDDVHPDKSSLEISIPTAGVTTLDKKRDEHLSSPDFFNSKQFPKISFKSKSIKKVDANHYEISGDLTLHGVTKPVTLNFNRMASGKDPMGNIRTGGETSIDIKRSDYNMTFMNGPGKVGDDVNLMISVEGVKI
jgi:polyisoprenoid-binding protein YceI